MRRNVAYALVLAASWVAPRAVADEPAKEQVKEAASPPAAPAAKQDEHQGSFTFGSYGRIVAASDAAGRPARDSDVVAHGSRLDSPNYVELELPR